MAFHTFPTLTLQRRPDEVILVRGIDGRRLEREGAALVPAWEALALLNDGHARRSSLRSFLVEARVFSPSDFRRLDDARLHPLVERKVRDGELVAVRPGAGAAQARKADPGEAVLMAVRAELRGGIWPFEGQTYQLIAGWELGAAQKRAEVVVVRPDQAAGVLDRFAKAPATSPRLRDPMARARDLLAKPWLLHDVPDGLVLLRHEARRSYATTKTEVVTPSALRAAVATDWIELVVKYEGDGAAYEQEIELELPDGRVETVKAGKDGRLRIESLPPGQVACGLPASDDDEWQVQPG
jgi:hypothetical protein